MHLEAGELTPWATSIIRPLVNRVVCSHPQSNGWIAKDADKSDRIDAYKLAELLQDENLVSLVQWLGPHRTAKPWQAQPDHRPSREISFSISRDESHIPEWLLKANHKNGR